MNAKQYTLTPEDLKKIKKEIKELKEKIIPQLAEELHEARADGDLRENAPFQILREKLADAKVKLAKYEEMLKHHVLVKTKKKDVISLGDTVIIEINGNQQKVTIVSEVEANPAENKFSVESPLGQALIGKKVGETTTLPNGTEIKIVKRV